MSVLDPFLEARDALAVAPDADAAAIKRAYRRQVVAHPPDIDPEGFRRVREAFELLSDPGARAREILLRPVPAVDPPSLAAPPEPLPPGALAVRVLRALASQLDLDALCAPGHSPETKS
ncbi:DnaJ domain-containing protein [Sorangium sp. So ce233]|uniref:DnaJ domain-containing protein n=1 Tax=Sorangium sp. So ce233 TaxID=3133290 RepID=UPI003F616253